MEINLALSKEFNIKQEYINNIVNLIDENCTIPFIARYRKELTGHCDDQVLREIYDRLTYLRNLAKRKEEVANNITEQGKMTDEIALSLTNALTLTEVEDIYRPFKQKKKTRASVAVEKGLQPLAEIILLQEDGRDVSEIANGFIDEKKGVNSKDEAIAGALDIIAETVSDNANLRKTFRSTFIKNSSIVVKFKGKLKDEDNAKTYEMYNDYAELSNQIPSHRILAINRGENEGVLKIDLEMNDEVLIRHAVGLYSKKDNQFRPLIAKAVADGYTRLIRPSIEREIRTELTEKAEEQAIKVFESNLRSLLLQPPIKNKVTLGLDPAYRTGCKIAVVDGTGKVLDTTVIYPTPPQSKVEESKKVLKQLINKHKVDIISIGNGTASKESEIFVSELIKELDREVSYMVVNEAGASVYSASKLAAEEFPDYDVSLRSAVSIARRLQDPLAELIKIDPKAIGVGQYQHDMPQARLNQVLTGVLEDCVNNVGVDINTASEKLLSFVSGLNSSIAKNIIAFREQNGTFKNREQLKKVPKLGPKAFEQSAGFLRITDGDNILDNTATHPESYRAVEKMLKMFNFNDEDVKKQRIKDIKEKIKNYGAEKVAKECNIGDATLYDVVDELLKPGRDIRDALPKPMLRSDIMDIKDLKEGMILKGTVRNVVDFGAFVDIGVHHDGLVHISEISNDFIKHPKDVLQVGQIVSVKVIGIDFKKEKISLSMKGVPQEDQNVLETA